MVLFPIYDKWREFTIIVAVNFIPEVKILKDYLKGLSKKLFMETLTYKMFKLN